MDFDPKIRLRPWQTALLGVVLATGLVFVFAPEVSLLGASTEVPSGPPTPTTVVPSGPVTTTGPDPQEVVPQPSPIGRASELPTTGRTYGPPISPLLPDLLVPRAPDDLRPAELRPRADGRQLQHPLRARQRRREHGRHRGRDQGAGPGRGPAPGDRPQPRLHQPHRPAGLLRPRARDERRVRGEHPPGRRRVRRGHPLEVPDRLPGQHACSRTTRAARRDQQRGVLNTRIQVGESFVSVYNTHLQHHFDSLRVRQMQTVMAAGARRPAADDHGRRPQLGTQHDHRCADRQGGPHGRLGRLPAWAPATPSPRKGRIDFLLLLRSRWSPRPRGSTRRGSPTTTPSAPGSPCRGRAHPSACRSSTNHCRSPAGESLAHRPVSGEPPRGRRGVTN